MKKRAISFFLTLAMLLSLLPVSFAEAASSGTADGITYTTYGWEDFERYVNVEEYLQALGQ